MEDLNALIFPLIKKASRIHVGNRIYPPHNEQLQSHFGGAPYFEKGETWPHSKSGRPLDFIFQVFNTGQSNLPAHIQLLQFFYDHHSNPINSNEEGWLVKTYLTLNKDHLRRVPTPGTITPGPYCKISLEPTHSLPDWESIDQYNAQISQLASIIYEAHPLASYETAASAITGLRDYQSQIGGYPRWIQGDETPTNAKGKYMELLFQIDSEGNAGLMWGDFGMVYVFYDPQQPGNSIFMIQSL